MAVRFKVSKTSKTGIWGFKKYLIEADRYVAVSSLHLYHLYVGQDCAVLRKKRAYQGCADICEYTITVRQRVVNIVVSFCWFFPLSFFLCPILQIDPQSGHQTPLLFSLYLLSMPFHPLSLCQLPLLCGWILEVHLPPFPFPSTGLKSPAPCWALLPYSKLSVSKTT